MSMTGTLEEGIATSSFGIGGRRKTEIFPHLFDYYDILFFWKFTPFQTYSHRHHDIRISKCIFSIVERAE